MRRHSAAAGEATQSLSELVLTHQLGTLRGREFKVHTCTGNTADATTKTSQIALHIPSKPGTLTTSNRTQTV